MQKLEKVVYTGRATATGGRAGTARSADGELDVKLSVPKELGGDGAPGVNPEEMFAAGYAACFIGAMKLIAGKKKIALPNDVKIDSAVGIGPIPAGFGIQVEMTVHAPGLERAQVQEIVDGAHQVCPYSNATRGNIEVKFNIA